MKLEVKSIGSTLQEVTVDEISTGTMDNREAIALAKNLLDVADTLLTFADMTGAGDICLKAIEEIEACE